MTVPGGDSGEKAPDGPNQPPPSDQPPAYPPPISPKYAGPQGGYGEQPGTNTLAIASLVASLVGLLCGIGSIVGIVLGTVAVNQIKQTREQGYGLAIAGIVVGIATLVISLILFITVGMH
jgi:drug/metabolite transporter (DMT)-like permease